jgi:response regulator RpfG family c-di-GMP phosphodiesterase
MNETGSKAAILIVDDEPDILDALREQLSWEGYEVVACAGGREALAILQQREFAVIISDQRMPGMSGLELMGHARKLHPNSSRVLLTGVLSFDTLVGAINQGEIFRFVAKPWMRAELLATIENAVQRHDLLGANDQLSRNTEKLNRQLIHANAQLQIQVNELTAQKEQIDDAHESLNENFEHSLGLCYRIINTFDPLLGKQTKAVVDLCRQMAHLDDFTPEEKHVLMASAWLHDIGLIGLDRGLVHRFFHKPQEVSEGDRALLREHPIYGQALAAFVDRLSAVGVTIRAHHERFDGQGYPDGLAGAGIPWTARCLAVAVAFVQPGLHRDGALKSILEQSGKAFDPEAVRVFLKTTHRTEIPRHVREIAVEELRPGMLIARGIYVPSGMLLIAEGQELTPTEIDRLKSNEFARSRISQVLVYR